MVILYRDPQGKNVFSESTPSSDGNSIRLEQENNRTIKALQCKVNDLQLALSQYESSDNIGQFERTTKVTFNEDAHHLSVP